MAKTFLELVKLCLPLGHEKRRMLAICRSYLEEDQYKTLRHYLKMDRLFGYIRQFNTSKALFEDCAWVEFKTHKGDEELHGFITEVNEELKRLVDHEAFTNFAKHARERIPHLIANNIAGMEHAKLAAAILLFAKDPVHLLLLGDPGTGKTEILRSVAALAPKGSFGLGSGTSGVGLAGTYKGDELILGLLPQAHQGIACIDELNLMKPHDRAALYNAMEKGFVTYEKGGKSARLDADVRVIATANPKGDKFVGQGASILKKQLPFASALLSRFHLVFLIRRPDPHELGKIARAIVKQEKQQLRKGDVAFMQSYIRWSWDRDVVFDKKYEPMIVNFIEDLAVDEKRFLIEIGPRTIIGIMRMAQAFARLQGKERVEQQDLMRMMRLLKDILYVRKKV